MESTYFTTYFPLPSTNSKFKIAFNNLLIIVFSTDSTLSSIWVKGIMNSKFDRRKTREPSNTDLIVPNIVKCYAVWVPSGNLLSLNLLKKLEEEKLNITYGWNLFLYITTLLLYVYIVLYFYKRPN